MVGKPLIFLFIDQEPFTLISFLDALHKVSCIITALVIAMDREEFLSMPDVLRIKAGKTALAE
jgi:hypothetical protein